MWIDPRLQALADDPAPQHAAQAKVADAVAEWRAEPGRAALSGELAAYGSGQPLDSCPNLSAVLAGLEPAKALAGSLVGRLAPVLAAEPLARLPFRQSAHGPSANLLLDKSGRAVLSLVAREPGRAEPDAVVGFVDGERHDVVLAGAGECVIVRRRADGVFGCEDVALTPGVRLSFDSGCETVMTAHVRRALVSLRLTRLAENPQPSREYRLSDGALLGQAAGDPRASRHEMMIALVGRMGRADAVPILAEMARAGCEHLRWQALRECLALDTATGFGALDAIARDGADSLAPPARALRARLIAAYPQLAALEGEPCPA